MEYTHNLSKSCWLHRWNTRGLIWHATKLWSALSVKLHAILFVWTHTIAHYLTLGVEDYLKPVDGDVWIQAMREESIDMPAFYPGSTEKPKSPSLALKHLSSRMFALGVHIGTVSHETVVIVISIVNTVHMIWHPGELKVACSHATMLDHGMNPSKCGHAESRSMYLQPLTTS